MDAKTESAINPRSLIVDLRVFAEGLESQAKTAGLGSAAGGHPDPIHFFGHSSAIMKAAADWIEAHTPVPPPSTPSTEPETIKLEAGAGVGAPTSASEPTGNKKTKG